MQRKLLASAASFLLALLVLPACGSESTSFGGTSANRKTVAPVPPAPVPTADATAQVPPAPTPAPKPAPSPATPPAPAPLPANAVTAGSFTVFATPADPKPFEDYTLTILVTLPANTANYAESDLSGNVVGTDGYTQNIDQSVGQDIVGADPGKPAFSVTGHQAKIVLSVPGAATKVIDTVNIKSTLLSEAQSLKVDFQ